VINTTVCSEIRTWVLSHRSQTRCLHFTVIHSRHTNIWRSTIADIEFNLGSVVVSSYTADSRVVCVLNEKGATGQRGAEGAAGGTGATGATGATGVTRSRIGLYPAVTRLYRASCSVPVPTSTLHAPPTPVRLVPSLLGSARSRRLDGVPVGSRPLLQ